MNHAHVLAEVTGIMREYFDDDSLILNPETTADDVEEWDSLSHVNILAAIEQHFGIRIAIGEMDHLDNVGDLVKLIEEKKKP